MTCNGRLILVIDDSADIRELFQLVLESAGFRVRVAGDGQEGLAAIREERPDLIITDVMMPGLNGFDFLIHLRSDFTAPLPPTIVCSGFDMTAEQALRLGAIRFVAKPIESAALIQIVEQVLEGQPSEALALENERTVVEAARARAAAAAARLFAKMGARLPEVESLLPVFAQWISNYFGFGACAILFVEHAGIRIAAASPGSPVPAGISLSPPLLFTTGVLASGSSLVIPDATTLSTPAGVDPEITKLGLRFIVAAPLLFQDVPVGALCLVDREPHPLEAEDLLTLEGFGRDGISDIVSDLESLRLNLGTLPPSLFDRILAAELSLLHRKKGGLDFVLVEAAPAAVTSKLALEMTARGGSRLAICRNSGTLGFFKRDSDAAAATRAVSASFQSLSAAGAVKAAGWVSIVDEGLPLLPSDDLLRLGALLLDQSRTDPARRIKRMVVGGAATPAGLFEPATP